MNRSKRSESQFKVLRNIFRPIIKLCRKDWIKIRNRKKKESRKFNRKERKGSWKSSVDLYQPLRFQCCLSQKPPPATTANFLASTQMIPFLQQFFTLTRWKWPAKLSNTAFTIFKTKSKPKEESVQNRIKNIKRPYLNC